MSTTKAIIKSTKKVNTMTAKTKTETSTETATKAEAAPTEEKKTLTPVEMCVEMHKKGMSEDDMITALTKHADLSIIKAVSAYKKFQKAAGLLQSPAEARAKAFALIEGFVTEDGIIDIDKAIDAVIEELDITKTSARARVKAYCKENKIEMPSGSSRAELVHTPVIAWFKENGTAIKTKKELAKALAKEFPEMSKSAANGYWKLFNFAQAYSTVQ